MNTNGDRIVTSPVAYQKTRDKSMASSFKTNRRSEYSMHDYRTGTMDCTTFDRDLLSPTAMRSGGVGEDLLDMLEDAKM